jgi:hypothetical protein
MSARLRLFFVLLFGTLLAAMPCAVLAQESQNPFSSREILVFSPAWSNPDEVPPFLMEKVSALLLSPGRHGWKFLQVVLHPVVSAHEHPEKRKTIFPTHLS